MDKQAEFVKQTRRKLSEKYGLTDQHISLVGVSHHTIRNSNNKSTVSSTMYALMRTLDFIERNGMIGMLMEELYQEEIADESTDNVE